MTTHEKKPLLRGRTCGFFQDRAVWHQIHARLQILVPLQRSGAAVPSSGNAFTARFLMWQLRCFLFVPLRFGLNGTQDRRAEFQTNVHCFRGIANRSASFLIIVLSGVKNTAVASFSDNKTRNERATTAVCGLRESMLKSSILNERTSWM